MHKALQPGFSHDVVPRDPSSSIVSGENMITILGISGSPVKDSNTALFLREALREVENESALFGTGTGRLQAGVVLDLPALR